jgi:hypothetical protein
VILTQEDLLQLAVIVLCRSVELTHVCSGKWTHYLERRNGLGHGLHHMEFLDASFFQAAVEICAQRI